MMKEKLYEICKEILKSEEETKKFSSYGTLDELYEYFLKKLPGLTEEEFDEFVCEALDNYAKEKETIDEIKDGALSDVSGGAGFREKAVAGFLGLMSIFSSVPSVVGATNAGNEGTVSGVSKKVSETKDTKTKNPGFFKRTKEWIKKHPKLTVGVGIGALLLAGTAITLRVIKPRSAAKSAEEDGNPTSSTKDTAVTVAKVEDKASPNDDKPDKKAQVTAGAPAPASAEAAAPASASATAPATAPAPAPAPATAPASAEAAAPAETDTPVVTKDETKNSTEDSYAHEVADETVVEGQVSPKAGYDDSEYEADDEGSEDEADDEGSEDESAAGAQVVAGKENEENGKEQGLFSKLKGWFKSWGSKKDKDE